MDHSTTNAQYTCIHSDVIIHHDSTNPYIMNPLYHCFYTKLALLHEHEAKKIALVTKASVVEYSPM